MMKKFALAGTMLTILAGCGTAPTGLSTAVDTAVEANAAKKNAVSITAFVATATKKIDGDKNGTLTCDEYMKAVGGDNNSGGMGQILQLTGWLSMGALAKQTYFELGDDVEPAKLVAQAKSQVIKVADFNKAVGSSFFQKNVQKILSSEFVKYDKNGNKTLEKSELSADDYKLMLNYDANKDGMFNLAEFADASLLSLVASGGTEATGLAQLALMATSKE